MNKTYLLLCAVLLISTACNNNSTSKQQDTQQSTNEEEKILLGAIDRKDLNSPEYQEWFAPTYKNYHPDDKTMAEISSRLQEVSIKVFMGTWCEDSQREIPAFYRILNDLNYDISELQMVGLDKTKTLPKEHLEGYDIEYVPTIIFYRGEEEIGRIIETPEATLEGDILGILE